MALSYKTGTSTDYKDLLEDLKDFITNDQAITAAVSAGGTGHAVGDILTASGGTSLQAVTCRVTAVSGGVVTGVELLNAGSYSVTPSNPVSTTSSGSGINCTLTLTWRAPWVALQEIDNIGAVNATPSAVGSGYVIGNTLTVSGGTGTAATFTVDSIDGSGGVTGVSMATPGDYTATPTNPASTTGGAGSGCTLVVNYTGVSGEKEKHFKGVGLDGTDEIYIGMRTYTDTEVNAYNWELNGFTGHDDGVTYLNQPGINPGHYESSTPKSTGGAFMPLDNGSIAYWFSVTARRIIVVAKISTSFMCMYMGFINPMATASELPYPLVISGPTCQHNTRYSSSRVSLSSPVDPQGKQSVSGGATWANGPMLLRAADGSWVTFTNTNEDFITETSGSQNNKAVVTPCGTPEISGVDNENFYWLDYSSPNWNWHSIVPPGAATTPDLELRPSPDSTDDLVVIFPPTLITNSPSVQIYGELDGIFWAGTAASGLVAEDKITVSDIDYRVFPAGNQSEPFQFFCIREP